MVKRMKSWLYFLVASYFALWAKMVLVRWRPQVVVVTGSSGKTTTFSLLKAQLSATCEFADDVNSAFGIPFYLLGIKRHRFTYWEWPQIFLIAPFKIFRRVSEKKTLVIEADVDRPHEGVFTSKLLQPDYVLLLNIGHTHAENFEKIVTKGKFATAQDGITHEYWQFVVAAKKFALINGDDQLVMQAYTNYQLPVSQQEKIILFQEADYLQQYSLEPTKTSFVINKILIEFNCLLPQETALGLAMTQTVCAKLGVPFREIFRDYQLPPGRSSLLTGIKDTTIIDSSYNASLDSMRVMLDLFAIYPSDKKWLVLGNLLEQGAASKVQHEKLADLLGALGEKVERYIFTGVSNGHYLVPYLQKYGWDFIYLTTPGEVLAYLRANLQGGETILIKGAPFLEGVVEGLLADPTQAAGLVRREKVYGRRRAKFYANQAA